MPASFRYLTSVQLQLPWHVLHAFHRHHVFKFCSAWLVAGPLIAHFGRKLPKEFCFGPSAQGANAAALCVPLELPFSVWLSVYATIALLIGHAIYHYRCPVFIKDYASLGDFGRSGGDIHLLLEQFKAFTFSKVLAAPYKRRAIKTETSIEIEPPSTDASIPKHHARMHFTYGQLNQREAGQYGNHIAFTRSEISHAMNLVSKIDRQLYDSIWALVERLRSEGCLVYELACADPSGAIVVYQFNKDTLLYFDGTRELAKPLNHEAGKEEVQEAIASRYDRYVGSALWRSHKNPILPSGENIAFMSRVTLPHDELIAAHGLEGPFCFFFGYFDVLPVGRATRILFDDARHIISNEASMARALCSSLTILGVGGWTWCVLRHLAVIL